MSRPPPATRAKFRAFFPMPTRWMDNDAYGHVNNVVYYAWFDTAVNRFLIDSGTLDIAASPVVGLVVETGCRYRAPVAYPEEVTIGLCVAHLGRGSVRYELAVFRAGEEVAAAEAHFVHVYVDRATRRPVPIPAPARAAMRTLLAEHQRSGNAVDLEAEYDNSAKVPNAAGILAGWARDAAAFRAGWADAELDLSYGHAERLALDLFWPGPSRDGPLAMFVHGGYWQRLDRKSFSHLARGLLAHGVAVAIPSYELCPNVTLSVLVEQVRDAAAFLALRHGRALLATGHSAGGHLAAMLLATDWPFTRGLPRATVKAALPVSGLFDLAPLTHTSVNDALGLDAAEARRMSPLFLPSPRLPIHAVVGGTEGAEYARQSQTIAEAWGGTWEAVDGKNHFSVIEPLADPASSLVATAVGMLSG